MVMMVVQACRGRLRLPDPAGRHRDDEGFGLVEALVAAVLVGTVLFALLGVFITAAQSIADQRLRATATRMGNAHLETLRAVPFAELEDHDTSPGGESVTSPDGRSLSRLTEVRRIHAESGSCVNPETGECDDQGEVKEVTVTMSWERGGDRDALTFSTVVAPPEEEAAGNGQTIGNPVLFPNPTVVDDTGTPTAPIDVVVSLDGYSTDATVTMSWADDEGSKQESLTSADGLNWTTTIDPSKLTRTLAVGETADLDFTFTVDDLSTSTSLTLQRPADSPPTVTDAAISQSPVTVAEPVPGRTCDARNQCENTEDVTFTLTVDGLDPAEDAALLQYQLYDGTFEEVPLTHVSGNEWQVTVRRGTTKFLRGTDRPFRFSAVRSADGATATTTVVVDVVQI